MPPDLHYGRWSPPDFSLHGHNIDQLIDVVHVFMLALFIPWGLFFLYCLLKYRQKPGQSAQYNPVKAKISKYAEIGVAVVEVFLLVGLSMPVWAQYKNDPPAEDERYTVRVIAQQFQWNAHYAGADGVFGKTDASLITELNPIGLMEEQDPHAADDIVTINDIHLPVGRPIYMRLTSLDVIHSFFIPTMRVKQDVIPGMEVPIWFEIDAWALSDDIRGNMTAATPIEKASWYKLRHHIFAEDVVTGDGEVMAAAGDHLGESYKAGTERIAELREAGVKELVMQPRHPLQVVCAQLCGNSHFKMAAQLITHDEAGFAAWQAAQKQAVEFEDF
jgi:cytochrome c oxidase subunit 2